MQELLGKTICEITGAEELSDQIIFKDTEGGQHIFYHDTELCETTLVSEIVGNITDLVDDPILQAEEVSSENAPELILDSSYAWTFYKYATIKGSVTIRWLSTSNSYYSEGVAYQYISPIQ